MHGFPTMTDNYRYSYSLLLYKQLFGTHSCIFWLVLLWQYNLKLLVNINYVFHFPLSDELIVPASPEDNCHG